MLLPSSWLVYFPGTASFDSLMTFSDDYRVRADANLLDFADLVTMSFSTTPISDHFVGCLSSLSAASILICIVRRRMGCSRPLRPYFALRLHRFFSPPSFHYTAF
jgi:hypothetical protein